MRKPVPTGLASQQLDPIERIVPLTLKLLVLLISGILFYQAAVSSSMFPPGKMPMPYYIYYVWIITPLHEGGHFLFMFFGRTLYILGGSFWQVMIPLLLFAVALKQRSFWANVYLIFAGVHLIALSPYIMDAPFRSLPLLGGRREGHDWYNLLIHWQMLDSAESLSDLTYYLGTTFGISGILSATSLSLYKYIRPPLPSPAKPKSPTTPRNQRSSQQLTELLNEEIDKEADDSVR